MRPWASKLAYRSALKNVGWLGCCGATSAAVKEEDKEAEEEREEPRG